MPLRCIHCGRQDYKVTLSSRFECVDRNDCEEAMKMKVPKVACIYFDGSCLGSNKRGGQPIGVGVYTEIDGVFAPEWSGHKPIKHGSNNDAEWLALIYALHVAKLMKKSGQRYTFKVFGDSQIVINAFNGVSKVGAKFKEYKHKTDYLRSHLTAELFTVQWVPREHNQGADKLSKEALLAHIE